MLAAWQGFQARQGPYAAVSDSTVSSGKVSIQVNPPEDEAGAIEPPTPEQAAAFAHLLEHQVALRDAILQATWQAYPEWQEKFADEEDIAEFMPNLSRAEDLKPLIGLSIVHILNVFKDGLAYVGYEFGCTWDEEHGMGAMTHGTRVVEVGEADISFEEWVATNDAESFW